MITLGLTGSIGMGKTTTANLFAEAGAYIYDADAAVHDLYKNGGAAVAPIAAAFPTAVYAGAVDRTALRAIVVEDPEKFTLLNAIVHPLVAESERAAREAAKAGQHQVIILDVPLLFENGGADRCDYTAVVTASEVTQRERVLSRPGMSEKDLQKILARQMPNSEKRARADFIISSDFGLDFAREHVAAIMGLLIRLVTAGARERE